jgi:hypothetical protein
MVRSKLVFGGNAAFSGPKMFTGNSGEIEGHKKKAAGHITSPPSFRQAISVKIAFFDNESVFGFFG